MLNKEDCKAQWMNCDVHSAEVKIEYWAVKKFTKICKNLWKTHKAHISSMSSQILVWVAHVALLLSIRPPDANSDMHVRNRGFQVRRASSVRISCTPERVLLHSPGKCSRFPPKTTFGPENHGYAFWELPKREFASGGLVFVQSDQQKHSEANSRLPRKMCQFLPILLETKKSIKL